MGSSDHRLVQALLHHVNVTFTSDSPNNVGREDELYNIKAATKIISGNASTRTRRVSRT